jgi:hypothetical protein
MGIQIEDGLGTGKIAGVSSENRLCVDAVSEPKDHHTNAESGKVWSLPFDGIDAAGNGDYIFYIQNTGDKSLGITDIRLSADTAATQIEIHGVTGTASGGSALTPVSRTVGSSAAPTATIETGTDITGLTSSGILFYMQLAVVLTEYHLRTTSNIIIPKGKAVGILVETGTANITGVVSLVENE